VSCGVVKQIKFARGLALKSRKIGNRVGIGAWCVFSGLQNLKVGEP